MAEKFNMPIDHTLPAHLLCARCGMCSTALNPNRVCWRHDDYSSDGVVYAFGKAVNQAAN